MEKNQISYMLRYFAAGIYFLGFWIGFLSVVVAGFTWPALMGGIMCGACGALCIDSYRTGAFHHDQYLRRLAQTCEEEENSEKSDTKQLLQD